MSHLLRDGDHPGSRVLHCNVGIPFLDVHLRERNLSEVHVEKLLLKETPSLDME